MASAHDKLERQLRNSVRHSSQQRSAGSRLRSRLAPALVAVLVVAFTAAIVVFAVVALHGRGSSRRSTGQTSTRPGISPPPVPGPIPHNVDDDVIANSFNATARIDPTCNRLPAITRLSDSAPSATTLLTVPVLQRRATSLDQPPGGVADLPFIRRQGGVLYTRYVRRVRQFDGATFYLFPLGDIGKVPLSAEQANRCYGLLVASLKNALPSIPSAQRAPTLKYGLENFTEDRYNLETSSKHDAVILYQSFRGGGAGASLLTVSEIQNGGQLGGGGGGKPYHPIVMDGVVPADVATVSLHFPKGTYRRRTLKPLTVTGKVINNVFVIPVPTLFERGAWPAYAVWRSTDGAVIKKINETPFHP